MNLKDLKPNAKNPRNVTDAKLKMLAKSMKEFGDLSGIVFNKTTQRLAGGHQRLKHVPKHAQIEIVNHYDEPTKQGTVSEGYITFDGQRWNFREVEWDELKESAANISANKGAGEWDYALLTEMIIELDNANYDLDLTMHDKDELLRFITPEFLPADESEQGQLDQKKETECPNCGEKFVAK